MVKVGLFVPVQFVQLLISCCHFWHSTICLVTQKMASCVLLLLRQYIVVTCEMVPDFIVEYWTYWLYADMPHFWDGKPYF